MRMPITSAICSRSRNSTIQRSWPSSKRVYGSKAKASRKILRRWAKGGSQAVGDFHVTMTHAFHSNSIDESGVRHYAGEPAGLVIRMPGGFTIYHAGDTAVFGDMKDHRRALPARPVHAAHRRPLHQGPARSCLRCSLARCEARHSHALRHVSFSYRHGRRLRKETQDLTGLTIHDLKPGAGL